MDWTLSSKKVLITGSTEGIGKSIAEKFLELGAHVFIMSRQDNKVTTLINSWNELGYKVTGMAADISKPEDCIALVESVQEEFQHLDVLINNVGPNFKKPVLQYSLSEFQSLINDNMVSTYYLTQLCHPLLVKSTFASIINIGAISSQVAFSGSGPYGMAKSAIESFTRSLALELGSDKIRANTISPGFIATETFLNKYNNEYIKNACHQVPLGRLGTPEDIAYFACFLAMPMASYINGQCIIIDGGMTVQGLTISQ